MDEPRPNPQPGSGIGWLVTDLSLRFTEQSKAKLGTTNFLQDHCTMLVTLAMVNNSFEFNSNYRPTLLYPCAKI